MRQRATAALQPIRLVGYHSIGQVLRRKSAKTPHTGVAPCLCIPCRWKTPEKIEKKEAHCDRFAHLLVSFFMVAYRATAGGTQGLGRYAPLVGRQAHTLYVAVPDLLRRAGGISPHSPNKGAGPLGGAPFVINLKNLLKPVPDFRKARADLISSVSCSQSGHPCHGWGPWPSICPTRP